MKLNSQQMFDILTFFRRLDRLVVGLDELRETKEGGNLSDDFVYLLSSITNEYIGSLIFEYIFKSPIKDAFEHVLDKSEWGKMEALSKLGKIENNVDGFVFIQEFTDNVYEDDIAFINFLEILGEIKKTDINDFEISIGL